MNRLSIKKQRILVIVMLVSILVSLALAIVSQTALAKSKAFPNEFYCWWDYRYTWGYCTYQECGLPRGTNVWKKFNHEVWRCCNGWDCWDTSSERDVPAGQMCVYCTP